MHVIIELLESLLSDEEVSTELPLEVIGVGVAKQSDGTTTVWKDRVHGSNRASPADSRRECY